MYHYSKETFPKDKETGKTILGSAAEMKNWVELGFEEQKAHHSEGIPFKPYIDLRNCILYVSYPIDKSEVTSRIFNLCDVVGIIPKTLRLENDTNGFLYQVNAPILFTNSILEGAFFHYVHFKERVDLENAIVNHSSFFKCKFDKGIFAQNATIKNTLSWDQCEFGDSVYMSQVKFEGLSFSIHNCDFRNELNLSSIKLNYPQMDNHPLDLYKNNIQGLIFKNLKGINRDVYISNCKIGDFCISNPHFEYTMILVSTHITEIGLIHMTNPETTKEHSIKNLILDRCNFSKQMHIERINLPTFVMVFCSILNNGLFRVSECKIQIMHVEECIGIGCMEYRGNQISELLLDIVLFGHLTFKCNEVGQYKDRETVRILKHEALECNDRVEAIKFDEIEKAMLINSPEWNKIHPRDKFILLLEQFTNRFGNNWLAPLKWMIGIVFLLTCVFFICSKYNQPDFSCNGIYTFFHGFLSNLNIFSIADFEEITSSYRLNIIGQIVWLFNKLIVTYLSYQCIVAFRKFNRNF